LLSKSIHVESNKIGLSILRFYVIYYDFFSTKINEKKEKDKTAFENRL